MIITCTLSANVLMGADILNTEGGFYIALPDSWVQVPYPILKEWLQETHQRMPKMKMEDPSFAYQPKPTNGDWLGYPRCLGFISRVGRPREYQFKQFAQDGFSSLPTESDSSVKNLSNGSMEDAVLGRPVYDIQRHILWTSLGITNSGITTSDRRAKGVIARVLTSEGGITLRFYCAESDFDKLLPQFKSMVESIRLPDELRYTPGFLDTVSWPKLGMAVGAVFGIVGFLFAVVSRKHKRSTK